MNNNLRDFMRGVYNWMAGGLLLTALTAYGVASSNTLLQIISDNPWCFYGLLILELATVVYFSVRIRKMSASAATTLFLFYSFLNGLSLSLIFIIYTGVSIALTFGIAAATFGVVSVYGATTKKDLSGVGHFARMALIGLIIASVVNIFLHSSGFDYIVSFCGILIFTALTAYDTQKIQQFFYLGGQSAEENSKTTIMGALTLYLDFINLFLELLRFFGKRRN